MEYSNTTLKNGLIQRYERHSLLGDGVVSGDTVLLKQVTADINESVYELTSDIIVSCDDFDPDNPYATDFPIATTPLIAGQRDYQFDNISFLKLKRLDITWNGTNWYRAGVFDSATFPHGLGGDTEVDAYFNKTEPKYDPKSFGFWLYPRAVQSEVDAGAKARAEYVRAYEEYTYDDTTQEPPIDRPFQDLIAIGAALRNPTLPADQYQKLKALYGERINTPNGVVFTGGRAAMVAHYGKRNEDFAMDINPQLQSYT
jgi:hypothetical protein